MEEDLGVGEGAIKREADPSLPDQSARSLKRKKTVTWADDELELPLAAAGSGADAAPTAAAAAAAAGPAVSLGASPAAAAALAAATQEPQQQLQQVAPVQSEAVVVLPCDGLYDALSCDLLRQQVGAPEPADTEPLTRRQLLERRLAHTEQLEALYTAELWGLLEELRLRHAQFVALPGSSVWRTGAGNDGSLARTEQAAQRQRQQTGTEGSQEQEAAAAEEQARQQPKKRQKQQAGAASSGKPAAAAVAAAAAAGSSAGKPQVAAATAEGPCQQQQQQQQQQRARLAASHPPAGGDDAPGSSLRALWELQQRGKQAVLSEPEEQPEGPRAAAAAPAMQQQQQPSKHGKQGQASKKQVKQKEKKGQQGQVSPAGKATQQAGRGTGGGDGGAAAAAAAVVPAGDAASVQQQGKQQQQAAAGPPALPRYEDVEQLILSGAADLAGLPPVDEAALLAAKRRFVQQLALLGRLEQSALAATCRELDALGGLALLCGRRRRYVLRRVTVALGRCTESQGKVDVDLTAEGEGAEESPGGCSSATTPAGAGGPMPPSAQRISRQQAQLFLDAAEGGWRLRCTGRRRMLVNGAPLVQGQTASLPSLSHISVGGISLLFVANIAATARVLGRSGTLLAA